MKTRTYRTEFPDFDTVECFNDILDWGRIFDAYDSSWHNDAMPSITVPIPGTSAAVKVWVNYSKLELRDVDDGWDVLVTLVDEEASEVACHSEFMADDNFADIVLTIADIVTSEAEYAALLSGLDDD